ncbi:transmembrane 9 superfamily member 3-like [Saccostrea echinata]|uniref:transmembrane 9 superfamily member 3-like n=1 Tax=Saccostrea echinata TaxID=191078 RepID=UPI002A8214FA|nr:transmembrane 9 superfamily member 3-like [Saccostrea echinata]
MHELEGNTITVQRNGIGPLILNEIIPVVCPEDTHGFSCMPCHQNCKGGCSKVDGTCTSCKNTHFGRMCQRKCHHFCSDDTCDRAEGKCRKENVVIIVVFFLCLVLIVASIIGVIVKRRTKIFKLLKRPQRPRPDDVIVTYSTTNRNVAVPSSSDQQIPSSPLSDCPVEYVHMIDGQNTIKMSPVEFIKYMKERQNVETLLKDLGSLPGWLMGRCFEAEKEENKPKNRSTTLLPYDRNRVVLEPKDDVQDQNDYINASYISSYRKEKAYILTLGPITPDTVLDFWRMVWQTNCKCVVMLAALREGEKKKCSKYWPDESGDCGPFFILIQNTETFDDYLMRKILLRKNGETRRLVHFQYTSWGEAKRHKRINTLLRLRTHVNSFVSSENVPVIIHSGPGISRMGIYIAIDYLLKQGLKEDTIDIMDCLVKLRSQRPYILRDRKEHQFLLSALETGFRTELLERLEEESDEEQSEDLYVNEQRAEELYYEDGEEVVLWMNTVGPYHNRQETYSYFSLPFCAGPKESIGHYHETLGEALQGTELEFSGLDIDFKGDVKKTEYCTVELTEEKYQAFVYAVKNHYWYQMYIDDLPIWGIVGEIGENKEEYFIWTHKKFDIGYNGKQIVDVNLTSEAKKKLSVGSKISFSYEVHFTPSSIKFDKRFDKYLDPNFFQHRIHWFSIFNSFMMVIFLVGLVSMILMRTLRKDYARYSKEEDLDDMEKDLGDEYGWKQVHGDVFRPPSNPLLFSSLIGTGYHIATVTLCVIIFSILGDLYTERGSLLSTAIFVYAATSPVNGYFGGSLYARMGGKLWIKQMLVGAFMLPIAVCGTAFFINFIAIYYHASRAIPFGTMVAVTCICIFVILPLTLVGTVLGRNLAGQPNYPCRVNAVPRPIPEKKWFMEPAVIIVLGGILPFGSIFIEMYFIFTSFWAYKIYYVYGFMLLVFVILTIVTVCVTIVCTYFLLNAEDYRWQWTSFSAAASTAGYVYLYSFYYFFFKTKMYGFFQTTFYFGYMALFSLALGLMCGTFGYIGTSYFVRKIYSTVKID